MKLVSQSIEQIKVILESASEAILKVYKSFDSDDIEIKNDNSPVTTADTDSNEILCRELKALFPHIPIISEENKEFDFKDRKDFDSCWIIDPLDGTKEFIKKNGEFTINLAYWEHGKIMAGWVYIPVKATLYWATKNEGAWMQKDTVAQRLSAIEFNSTDDLIITCSRSHVNQKTLDYLTRFSNHTLLPQGSAIKVLSVADGTAHLYPRFGPTMEWDIAPAQLILEEAGGSLVSLISKKPLQYNKENLLNDPFIAIGNYLGSENLI
jgi:3'(2'), 5'-bisphosphate nucleotidase